MPFLALIIGPYSQKNKTESLLKIFHIQGGNSNKTLALSKGDYPKPYELSYKILPCNKLRKSFLGVELKGLLQHYRDHRDLIDLTK